jgi:hypothetical protein
MKLGSPRGARRPIALFSSAFLVLGKQPADAGCFVPAWVKLLDGEITMSHPRAPLLRLRIVMLNSGIRPVSLASDAPERFDKVASLRAFRALVDMHTRPPAKDGGRMLQAPLNKFT